MILTLAYCLVCTNNSVVIWVELSSINGRGKYRFRSKTVEREEKGISHGYKSGHDRVPYEVQRKKPNPTMLLRT